MARAGRVSSVMTAAATRPFKFRAWVQDEECFRKIWKIYWGQHGLLGVKLSDENYQRKLPIESVDLEQFTGRVDKNNQDVYEGDLLKIDDYILTSPFLVRFFDEAFIAESLSDTGKAWPLGSFDKPIEVIGNIHESPELLP